MHRFVVFLMLMLLFSCSQNPVDKSDSPKAKGKITIVCKSASSVTAKIAATDRAEIWIWKTLDTMPAIYPLTKEAGATFTGEFDVDAGTYPRITVKGYANDTADPNTNTVTYFGSSLDVTVTPLPAVTTVNIGLIPLGTVSTIAGIDFVSIPDGTFQMGDEVGDLDFYSRPVHTVTVSGFEMGRYEITNKQYCAFLNAALASGDINATGSSVTGAKELFRSQEFIFLSFFGNTQNKCWITYNGESFSVVSGKENWPVVAVTWYGSKAFAVYYGLDLPTEAEWEYACRGGKQHKYGTDDGTIGSTKANYNGPGYLFHPVDVGNYPKNPFGLYDICGNVWEWCHDWYGFYSSNNQSNPSGVQTGDYRVFRGGCWGIFDSYCRSAYRYVVTPGWRDAYMGFRVVRRAAPQNY